VAHAVVRADADEDKMQNAPTAPPWWRPVVPAPAAVLNMLANA
jgi:hypothetical protein